MYERETALFKALSDENRLRIIAMLRCGERCACRMQDELGIGQPTLSYHMGLLCASGIVSARREGRWTYYSISREGCERAKRMIDELTEPCGAADAGK
ncbi:MAG TPA: winged helix-turn-helix transcriptional regulator [Candidatus Fimadaptatus faecigallinarum]|uniref:Winged helix-turn-helix transcriptional regulator n=1 Tax=Candidatus Fimadaptatus faecigallinarum TaxID=2840814 RepID=A0A9D1LQI4_9FIRM|nr:winged helix-turn-helix transcriptional regulator [Candidatus Fimadaptatus faecigallinarum]